VATRGSSGLHPDHRQPKLHTQTFKLLFRTDEKLDTATVALRSTYILDAIANIPSPINSNVTIFDQDQAPLLGFDAETFDRFPSLLKVHSVPAHINHKRQHQSWIIFHVQSSVHLSTIKQNATVATLLSQTKGHLCSHPWPDSVQDVVSLGFFSCAIPHYQSSESFASQVVKAISKTASADNIPLFPCVPTRVSRTLDKSRPGC
jgi:hypothetical protein